MYLNVMKSGLIDNLRGNTSGTGLRNPEIEICDSRKLLMRKSKKICKLSSRCLNKSLGAIYKLVYRQSYDI